jgi:ubiquinone/menaquinone biosynthesis C-methylase UbiE
MKAQIKQYWERHPTQLWYSDLPEGTLEFFEDIERKRYTEHYAYLKTTAEFDRHAGEKVLEIGCGPGTDAVQFAKGGAQVTCVDLAERAVALTRRQFELRGLQGEFLASDAEHLPFEDASFDLVYSFGVLHHTPDTQGAINEVFRVLKPGGKAIVMLYHKWSVLYFKLMFNAGIRGRELFSLGAAGILNKHTEMSSETKLTKAYSKREVRQMFGRFQRTDIEVYNYPPFRQHRHLLFLNPLQEQLGWNLWIKAIR